MIQYDSKKLSFICRLEGSNLPKALRYTIPSIALTVASYYLIHAEHGHFEFLEDFRLSIAWSAIYAVLSILLGVRTNKAYDRFWEGITLIQQMRAEWFEAASNLMAFSMIGAKQDTSKAEDVRKFQHLLVRLMSLMHGSALRQIGGNKEDFDVLDVHALDPESQRYLAECELNDVNRVEVLLHWIQVLVTENHSNRVIMVAAPILTRAYQTLSRGMVNMHNARKLADVPFPFALNQVIIVLLLFQSILTPLVVASALSSPACAVFVAFVPLFGMWSVSFVSAEIEQPFGSDPNDLPLSVLQYDFNMTLLMLLDETAQRAPTLSEKSRSPAQLRSILIMGEENVYGKSGTSSRTNTVSYNNLEALGSAMKRTSTTSLLFPRISFNFQARNSSVHTVGTTSSHGSSKGGSHHVLLNQRKEMQKAAVKGPRYSSQSALSNQRLEDSTPRANPSVPSSYEMTPERSHCMGKLQGSLNSSPSQTSISKSSSFPESFRLSATSSGNHRRVGSGQSLERILEVSQEIISQSHSALPRSKEFDAEHMKVRKISESELALHPEAHSSGRRKKRTPRTPRVPSPMTSPRESEFDAMSSRV